MSMAGVNKNCSKKQARVAEHKRKEARKKHEMLRKTAEGSGSINHATRDYKSSDLNDDEEDNYDNYEVKFSMYYKKQLNTPSEGLQEGTVQQRKNLVFFRAS